MKAMILAAGVGSRLDPLTIDLPKPLVPIANYAILEHIIFLLKKHNFTNITANLHYMADKILDFIGDGHDYGVNIDFVVEQKLTGDAGGMRACKSFFDSGTFLVINADLLTDFDLTYIIQQHKQKKSLASIALTRVNDVSQFGVALTDINGFITGFQEKPKPEEALSNLISTGIYVFEPEIFDYIPESGTFGFGKDLFPKLLDLKLPLLGIEVDGYWTDIGTIPKYCQSNFDVLENKLSTKKSGNIIRKTSELARIMPIDDSVEVDGNILLGRNCTIMPGVKLFGNVIIGNDTVIGKFSRVENSVIWHNNTIIDNSRIRNTIIGIKEIACVI